jgi:dihydrofolate reductase
MTVKCSVYIATSLDGFIARPDGDVEWLNNPEYVPDDGSDYGFKAFIETVDVLVMGRRSFEKVLSFGFWPYEGTPVVVLSSQKINIRDDLAGKVRHINAEPAAVVSKLAVEGAHHLYIDGGVTIQRFLAAGLIDEITLSVIPILLGNGIPLFGSLDEDISLRHLGTSSHDNGLVQSKYTVVK